MALVDDIYLNGFAFPCALIFDDVPLVLTGGSLFPSPNGTRSDAQIQFYRNSKSGWHRCPMGYAIYVLPFSSEHSARIVVYGLKVNGVSIRQGRETQLTIKTERVLIEKYVRDQMASIAEVESRLQSVISSGVHEYRNINKDLYAVAYRLVGLISDVSPQWETAVGLSKNIVALSELIRSRSDVFDVISNPIVGQIPDMRIPVYRAFDRVRLSLSTSASSRKVWLRMRGSSYGFARAVQMFDVVPYIILQNAVKYSPEGGEVNIEVREDDEFIYSTVNSYGPAMSDEELERVFVPGFRGRGAQAFESQGSGMGLFVVKRLIDYCESASIRFTQIGEPKIHQTMVFREVSVFLKLKRGA